MHFLSYRNCGREKHKFFHGLLGFFVAFTIPFQILCHFTLGAGFAEANKTVLPLSLWYKTPAFWALLICQIFVFFPVGTYLLWRYPEWSLVYQSDSADTSGNLTLLALTYPLSSFLGYLTVSRFIRRSHGALAFVTTFVAIWLTVIAGFVCSWHIQNTMQMASEDHRIDMIAVHPPIAMLWGIAFAYVTSSFMSIWRLIIFEKASLRRLKTANQIKEVSREQGVVHATMDVPERELH